MNLRLLNMKTIVIPLLLILLLPLLVLPLPVSRASSVSGSWTQTTPADFQSGTLNNLDASSSPGYVKLASGGSLQQMGIPPVNRTGLGFNGYTVVDVSSGSAAPISGYIVSYSFFTRYVFASPQFQLKIFRFNGTHFLLEAQSPLITSVAVGHNTITLAQPLPVQRGDLLGFWSINSDLSGDYTVATAVYYSSSNVNSNLTVASYLPYSFILSVQADILPTATGSLTSSIKDTGGLSSWGTISWIANTLTGTSISFYTRTSNDFTNWSPWSANYTSSGSAISSPTGRFIQYRAVFAANGTLTPILHSVTITYSTTPTTSSVLLSLSTQSVTSGSNITVSGMLSPNVITTVTLTYVRPDGTSVNRTTSSNAQGFFSDSYAPDTTGTWKVRASSAAVSTISAATSAYSAFEVQASPSILSTFLPWLILIIVVVGFGVAVLLTKPKTPKMG